MGGHFSTRNLGVLRGEKSSIGALPLARLFALWDNSLDLSLRPEYPSSERGQRPHSVQVPVRSSLPSGGTCIGRSAGCLGQNRGFAVLTSPVILKADLRPPKRLASLSCAWLSGVASKAFILSLASRGPIQGLGVAPPAPRQGALLLHLMRPAQPPRNCAPRGQPALAHTTASARAGRGRPAWPTPHSVSPNRNRSAGLGPLHSINPSWNAYRARRVIHRLPHRFSHVLRPSECGRLLPHPRKDALHEAGIGLRDGALHPGLCVLTEARLWRPCEFGSLMRPCWFRSCRSSCMFAARGG
jgi:hypothetical protein